MKKLIISSMLVLAVASIASATTVNLKTDGLTGLWRFHNSANTMEATIGTDLVNSHVDNGSSWIGPWTSIEPGLSDNGIAQCRSWDYFQVFHGIAANGGGSYVNEYTVAFDYVQTGGNPGWNAFYQTAADPRSNDADLWSDGDGHIGVGDTGYSTLTYDPSEWNRIVLSVDNANFFRVYVNGVLFLDAAAQGVDGRFSLNDNFYFLTDNSWEDQWGLVGTLATWDHALTTAEVAAMGGWIDGAAAPTPLIIPEPATMFLLSLGGLLLRRRK